MSTVETPFPLTARSRAMLRAVAEGRAEMSSSCEPDLFVDGLSCCDQTLAHALTHAQLIRPVHISATPGRRPVALTRRGVEALLSDPQQLSRRAG